MAPAAGLGEAKSAEELDEFVTTLRTQVEIFVNRMKSNSSRGRSIANDSSVQTLFMNAMSMHSQLLKHIQEQEDKRVYYEGLQDKLTQVNIHIHSIRGLPWRAFYILSGEGCPSGSGRPARGGGVLHRAFRPGLHAQPAGR